MSKSKKFNLILLIVIIVIVIAIGVGVYFLVTKEKYTEKYVEKYVEKYTDPENKYTVCSENNSNLTVSECQEVATKFNKTFNGQNGTSYNYGSTYPKGCFAVSSEDNANNIYFNDHETGSERSGFASFCKNQPSKNPEVIKIETSKWKIIYPDPNMPRYNFVPCDPKTATCLTKANAEKFMEINDKYDTECIWELFTKGKISSKCQTTINQLNTEIEKEIITKKPETIINSSLLPGFNGALNKFSNTSKSKSNFTLPENYTEEDKKFRRLETLFREIIEIGEKSEDYNQMVKNTESVIAKPKRLLNYEVYLKLITKCYYNAMEDANDLENEEIPSDLSDIEEKNINHILKKKGIEPKDATDSQKRRARSEVHKKFVKDNVSKIFFYLKKQGTFAKAGFNEQLITKLAKDIGESINVDIKESFGFDYDTDGNLREYQGGGGGADCYLITACTKSKLLSIGQVYQLRKVMLEAFKDPSNHKFFHFYYSNFREIADFLESTERLSEIVPGMLEVVELSKRGEFQSAFEKYISTCRKAYQMCKDAGMDVSEIEQEWDSLEDFKMITLPEPNTLFVEEPFKKVLRHFGTVC